MSAKRIPVENLTFEAALDELQGLVKNLESGQTALEESITAYERGTALKNHCERKLREARAKIEKISIGKDGTVALEPFDQQE